jgi:parallel beta-helix repeat protein
MLGFLLSWDTPNANGQSAVQLDWQEKLIMAEKGDTILLPAGSYQLTQTLSMDRKEDVTILGAGSAETILSFENQIDGGEGLRITNGKNITLQGLTIIDATGDAVKAQYVDGIVFNDISTRWSGKPSKNNGAYGLYPVQCKNVLIDHCYAYGASDAGIYVGQSDQVIVRNSTAEGNVAGIEIENTTNAEVYDNIARSNTGGILIFDLPDLEKKKGGHVKVYQNQIVENNYKNFAPKGNIVAQVPPGTGIMIMATSDVEIYRNTISNNRTINSAVMSYYITELEIKDEAYNPYPSRIYIHDNEFDRKKKWPLLKNKFGWLFFFKFGKKIPNIVYDGILHDNATDGSGKLTSEYEICISNNRGETFANLDAAHKFKQLTRDISLFQCQ